jgi:hypothetical protein
MPAGQQSLDADMFIQVGPLDRVSVTQETPILPLHVGSVEQAWIPGQRHLHAAAVRQLHAQVVIRHYDICGDGLHFKHQRYSSELKKTKL